MLYSHRKLSQKGSETLKSLDQLTSEQMQREGRLLSQLLGESRMEDLARFEASLTEQQSRLLFEITTEIEDTENALEQADQLVQRLKKHLEQLKGLQRVLSK
jgi:formate dehydrogenase maturation protein FdhE